MERRNYDRDDTSHSGRPVHTYTPRSHEDLIKSHLNLDEARKAKIQNELGRLAAENDRLRMDLESAYRDIRNKDNEIRSLNMEVREKSTAPSPPAAKYASPLYEVDGKQLSVDEVIDHFNVIIQRHHDLINRKNQQIQELQDALNNQPIVRTPPKRDAVVQSSKENDINHQMMADFSNQMDRVRREYEQAENKLMDRNNRLERTIDDLQRKLADYQNEIKLLRDELSQRAVPPQRSESTEKLLQDKEQEIAQLKDLIERLKNQNDGSGDDFKKLVENKKDTISTINKIVNDINLARDHGNPDLQEVEKDCRTMINDLNSMNDKLNNILNKVKESPASLEGEPLDKKYLIDTLENIKNQCQDEIVILENKIHPGIQKSISDIGERHDVYPETPGYAPSPQPEMTPSMKTVTIADQQPYSGSPYRSKIYPMVPCEACSTPYLPQDQDRRIREVPSPPPDRKLIHELYKPTRPRSQSPDKSKKSKGGCCGKKGSDSSNIPYTKKEDEKKNKGGCCGKKKSESSNLNYYKKNEEFKAKGGCCGKKRSEERLMQVYEPPREDVPSYKIGLGSRMGNAYYHR